MSETAGIEVSQGEANQEAVNSETQSTAETQTETQQESKVNPNWNEALELLPDDMLRNKLSPVFEKWDKNNNSRFEKVQQEYAKYDPYKPLVENQVPFEDIAQAYQLREKIMNDPRFVFEQLAQGLGIDISGLLDGEQSQGLEENNPEGTVDPQIAELKRVQELQNAYLAEQYRKEQELEQQKQEQRMFEETKTALDKLTETYGNFDRNRAVQFALWEAEKTGKQVDLEAGVKAMLDYEDGIRKSSANNSAPNVFSGTGGMPSGVADTSKMTDDEVIALSVAKLKAKNGG